MASGIKYCKLKFIVTRKTITTVFVDMEADYTGSGIYTAVPGQATFESSRTVGNMTAAANLILFSGGTVGSAVLSQQKMSVTLFKI